MRRLLVLALLTLARPLAAQAPLPGAVPFEIEVIPASPAEPWRVIALDHEGVLYLAANQFSALLHLEKFWRADLGRLILSGKSHRISVIEGTELAVIDDGRLLHLPGPAFLWQGQMMLPIDLFVDVAGEPLPWVEAPLVFSKSERVLRIGVPKPVLSGGRVTLLESGWRLQIVATGRLRAEVRQEAGPELVVQLAGARYDPERQPLPSPNLKWLPWVFGYRCQPSADGVLVHLLPGASTRGYRVTASDSNRVEITLGSAADSLVSFPGNALADVHRIAIDPGHGGSDTGVIVKGSKETKLDWALAGYLRERLQDAGIEVVLTRAEAEDPSPEARSEAANRSEADLLLSLHIHGRRGGPVAYLNTGGGQALAASPLDNLGFRHYGTDHGLHESESRAVAGALLQSVMAGGLSSSLSPGIETESVPELAGARMPAVLLELGTDPKKSWSDDRLRSLAESIAAGIRTAAGFH
jgi:N-acetylmuramoyl-L-alanine amidase